MALIPDPLPFPRIGPGHCTRCRGTGEMCCRCELSPLACPCYQPDLAACESCDGQSVGGVDRQR